MANEKDDRGLTALRRGFIGAADHAKKGSLDRAETLKDAEPFERELAGTLHSIAELLTDGMPEWSFDENHPGYLYFIAGKVTVRAPFSLVHDFPPKDVWLEIANLAVRIRAADDSVICLSGSSAQYGSLYHVADIDLCEYAFVENAPEPPVVLAIRKIESLRYPDLTCFQVKVDASVSDADRIRRRPWSYGPYEDDTFLAVASTTTSVKCDFLAATTAFGPLAMSNIVLAGSAAMLANPSFDRSFVFQEAPLSSFVAAYVPRRLDSVRAAGHYVQFLRNDVESYVKRFDRNPEHPHYLAKAAKRALALTRVLFRGDLAETILRSAPPELFAAAAASSRKALLADLAPARGDSEIDQFCGELEKWLHGQTPPPLSVAQLQHVRDVLIGMVDAINQFE